METRINKSLFLVIILFYSCTPKQVSTSHNGQRKEWIKDYAFCWCMKVDYDREISNTIFNEDPSLGILFDIGNVKFYNKIDSLTNVFLNEIDSRSGEKHGEQAKHVPAH